MIFLHLGLLDVVVFEWSFFGFALSKDLFFDGVGFLFVDEESKDKGERLLLSINVGGRSDDEEDASIYFLDSRRTCICRVGC